VIFKKIKILFSLCIFGINLYASNLSLIEQEIGDLENCFREMNLQVIMPEVVSSSNKEASVEVGSSRDAERVDREKSTVKKVKVRREGFRGNNERFKRSPVSSSEDAEIEDQCSLRIMGVKLNLAKRVKSCCLASSSEDAEQADQERLRIEALRNRIQGLKSRLKGSMCYQDADSSVCGQVERVDIEAFMESQKLLARLAALESNFPVRVLFLGSVRAHNLSSAALKYSQVLSDFLSATYERSIELLNIKDNIGSKLIELLTLLSQGKLEKEILNKISEYRLDNDALMYLFNVVNYLNIPNLETVLIKFIKRELYSENEALLKALLLKLPIELISKFEIKLLGSIPSNSYRSVRMSSCGNRIAALGRKNHLHLFDGDGREIELDSTTAKRQYSEVQVNASGNRIVAKGWDNKLYLFNGDGREIELTNTDAKRKYCEVQFSLDGSRILAVGHEDRKLYLFNGDGREIVSDRVVEIDRTQDVKMSADASVIAAIRSDDSLLCVFGKLAWSNSQREYESVTVSANGDRIAASGGNGHLYIFNKFGEFLRKDSREFFDLIPAVMSEDGSTIVAIGREFDIYMYNFAEAKEITLGGSVPIKCSNSDNIIVSRDGRRIFVIDHNDDFYIFDQSGRLIVSDTSRKYKSMVMSPDGNRIVAVERVTNATEGENRYIHMFDSNGVEVKEECINNKIDHVYFCVSSGGNRIVMSGSYGGLYQITNLKGLFGNVLKNSTSEERQVIEAKLRELNKELNLE
jgi:WD40 repeat protein